MTDKAVVKVVQLSLDGPAKLKVPALGRCWVRSGRGHKRS